MSEEEKKAIHDLKILKLGLSFLNCIPGVEKDEIDIKAIDIILNLIENQQEEISFLKDQLEYVKSEYEETIEQQQEEIEEIEEFVDLIGMNENEEELFKMIRCCTHKIDELVKSVNKMKEGKE